MDTSLDNANNPFANSNGADNNIIGQKSDGLLLNLSENFKHNGADLSPTGDFFHNSEKSNGKRLASEFDDDDDLGPETDVDAVDDVLSPSIAAAKALADGIVNNNPDGSFNPFVEKHEVEKAALEIDLDLQKQQSSEFDGQRSPREETPTPPADAVHDGGLEENIGDSGEESEDEWNYIKGEEANKENISPSQPDCEVADILEDQENMSQLNPNAAEFVPVSPTRSNPSPACRLMHDPVIAQSPKRPTEIDISLPNPQDFEKEVKSRPSDVDSFSNGHDHEGDQKPLTHELMENLLNGKNIDEIPEFQPGSTPSKGDEFHFGPNAAPFTPVKLLDQSEAALSTKAVYGDESTVNLDVSLDNTQDNVDFTKLKEDDPMSMSFYQDKNSGDADPFDLNKVQVLPENIEDFLNKPEESAQEDTISSLPEEDQAKDLLADEVVLNNDERIQTTDLDKVDDEKELASPVSNDDDSSGVCELSKSPQPQGDDFMNEFECHLPKDACLRPESKSPANFEITTPEPEIISPEPTIPSPLPPALSPVPQTFSPEPAVSPMPTLEPEVCTFESKPVLFPEPAVTLSSELQDAMAPRTEILTPELTFQSSVEPNQDVCQFSKSPVQAISPVPAEDICSFTKTPEPEKVITPEPEKINTPEPERLIDIVAEERRELSVESPMEDITSSVKDVSSPISSPIADQDRNVLLNFAQEINSAEQSTVSVVSSSPVRDFNLVPEVCGLPIPKSSTDTEPVTATDVNSFLERSEVVDLTSPVREFNLIPEVCGLSTPKSATDTESVATTDVNSFLERSEIVDLTSPLSPADSTMTNHPLSKCVYPLPTEIETENITPEFAESVVISPTEPKEDTPSAPSLESPKEPEVVQEIAPIAAAAAGVAAVAAVAATAAEKKPTKAKTPTATKKPAAKPAAATTKSVPSPTKTRAPIAKAKPAPAKTTTPTRTSAGTATKPPVSKLAPKPRVPAATKPAEKKPLANGDVKAPARAPLTKRSVDGTKPAPAKPATTTLNKASPTKPPVPRPTTAPARTATKPATTTTAPKPRPTTLASKTASSTVSRTVTSTTATKSSTARTSATTSTLKTSSSPRPRPATAPAKPRVPATRTVSKPSADTEKQSKDSANKLTASRTTTSTRTTTTAGSKTLTSTVRKTESKPAGTTRTTVTKTSTTTMRPVPKKSLETVRNGTKVTKTETPVQNGVTTVVTEETTIVNNALNNGETLLLKDNSPIDNKLLVDTNTAD